MNASPTFEDGTGTRSNEEQNSNIMHINKQISLHEIEQIDIENFDSRKRTNTVLEERSSAIKVNWIDKDIMASKVYQDLQLEFNSLQKEKAKIETEL